MELNDKGQVIINIDELLTSDEILKQCARHAVFVKEIFNGLAQLLIKDEVDFEDGNPPWYCTISFGQSYFEEIRIKLLENLSGMESTQITCLQHERDTYRKFYEEYLSKFIEIEKIGRAHV
jgi:hypothetical protein